MAVAGSRIGAPAITKAFVQILVDHLQEELNAIALERDTTALTAPNEDTGYAEGRIIKLEHSPAIRIFLDRSEFLPELHNLGSSRRKWQYIRVEITYGDALDRSEMTDAVATYAQAIQTQILKYWRGHATDAHMRDVVATSEERSASLDERYSSRGWSPLGGESPSARDEDADINFRVTQSVYAPVSFAK